METVKAPGDVLPEEFIGMNMSDGPFANRARILEAARAFRERGGRLVRLTCPPARGATRLVINLKTAKALGLTIPPSLLQRADQVIE